MSQNEKIGFFSNLPERERVQVTLPSGREITILESTGREEKILARLNQDKSKFYENFASYLAGVTEGLDGQEGKIPPSKFQDMLLGDRIYIVYYARLLTHGPAVEHKMNCSSCNQPSTHEIDLQAVVDSTKPYPKGDQREFSVDLGGGVLHYELPNGRTEARMDKDKEGAVLAKLRSMRLWEVTKQGNLPVSLETLKSRQIKILREHVRESECLIDNKAELICPECSNMDIVDVGSMSGFLFPSLI